MRRQGENANKLEAAEQLRSDLKMVAQCCHTDGPVMGLWPTYELLHSLEENIAILLGVKAKRSTIQWTAIQRLDRRMPSLRVVHRLNGIVNRARQRLAKAGQSALEKLAWRDTSEARKLRNDIEKLRSGLPEAKGIDWEQHQSVLRSLSERGIIRLSCGDDAASQKVRCYARVLELIVEDYRYEPLRKKAWPLIRWVSEIGHPEANSLCDFDYVGTRVVNSVGATSQRMRVFQKRQKGRERQKRHRQSKNSLPEERCIAAR